MIQIVSPEERAKNFEKRKLIVSRALAVMFSHDFLFDSEELQHIPMPYVNYLFDVVKEDDSKVIEYLNTMNKQHMMRVIENLENSISLILYGQDQSHITKEVVMCIGVLEYFYSSNEANPRVSQKDFQNEACSNSLNLQIVASQYYTYKNRPPSPNRPFLILDYPWLFSTEAKVDVLRVENQCTQHSQIITQINQGLQGGNFMNLLNPMNVHLSITVRRDHILEDSLVKLSNQGKNLKKPLRITFMGEAGVDAGGVKKEFFLLLTKELFKPEYAMFTVKNVHDTYSAKIPMVQQPEF